MDEWVWMAAAGAPAVGLVWFAALRWRPSMDAAYSRGYAAALEAHRLGAMVPLREPRGGAR